MAGRIHEQKAGSGLEKSSPICDPYDFLGIENQPPHHGDRILVMDTGGITESYIKGGFLIEVSIEFGDDGHRENYVAVFQKAAGFLRMIKIWNLPIWQAPFLWCHSGFSVYGPYWNDHSMLVGQIEGMETPQHTVSSLVWFQSEEEFARSGAGLRRFVSDFSFDPDRIGLEWEACPIDIAAASIHESRDHMVQRGPRIMDGIASDKAQLGRCIQELYRAIGSLPLFFLDGDCIWLPIVKLLDLRLKVSKVALRPTYFGKGRGVWFTESGGHVQKNRSRVCLAANDLSLSP